MDLKGDSVLRCGPDAGRGLLAKVQRRSFLPLCRTVTVCGFPRAGPGPCSAAFVDPLERLPRTGADRDGGISVRRRGRNCRLLDLWGVAGHARGPVRGAAALRLHGFPWKHRFPHLCSRPHPRAYGDLVGNHACPHVALCLETPRDGFSGPDFITGAGRIHRHCRPRPLSSLLFRNLLSLLRHVLGLCVCEHLQELSPTSGDFCAAALGFGARLVVGGVCQASPSRSFRKKACELSSNTS